MPTTTARPAIPAARRTTRLVLRLSADLHEECAWIAYAHHFVDLEDWVLDVLTDQVNEHSDCRTCRRVARGGRPRPSGRLQGAARVG